LVPISIISQNNPKPVKVLLENRNQEVILENVEANEWIKLNPGSTSFHRTNYPDELIEQFKESILNKNLSTIDRINLQDDLFALVQSGKISSDRILKFMQIYENETEYAVWDLLVGHLNKFNSLLGDTDFQEVYHLYVRKLLSKIHSIVGYKPVEGESHQAALLRSTVISLLVSCKDPEVLREAKQQFEAHVSKSAQISPDLRLSFYRAVIMDCDDKTYDSFFNHYREADVNEEKVRILRSMAATENKARIQKLIDFAMTEVRSQDIDYVLSAASASNKVARQLVWNYFKENHQLFVKKYVSGNLLSCIVEAATKFFTSEEHYKDIKLFFDENPIPSTERKVQQSLENIKLNSNWISRDSKKIKDYLINLK